MEITGKLFQILEEVTGQGKNGTWRKKEFVIETQEQYPKKVCFALWGDKIDQFKITIGETITASISIESREYNGRYFTEVRAWKIAKGGSDNEEGKDNAPVMVPDMPETDDLPF